MNTFKASIEERFSRAAASYPNAAVLQKMVAEKLAGMLPDDETLPHGQILEIGCGTGFLSRLLVEKYSQRRCLITDLSQGMLKTCQSNCFAGHNVQFEKLDGEEPLPTSACIVSSLAFQWFEDVNRSLINAWQALQPGGYLLISTLTDQSFPEWKAACQALAVPFTGHQMPIVDCLPKEFQVIIKKIPLQYPSAAAFLHTLKQIGASASQSAALPTSQMKSLLKEWSSPQGVTVTYSVAYIQIRKPL